MDTTDAELSVEEQRHVRMLREQIGSSLDDQDPYLADRSQFVSEVNKDSIRHYAWGISDMNPLWMDEVYAAASPQGSLVAPPSMLFALAPGGMSASVLKGLRGGMFGANGKWGGATLRSNRWIRPGTKVSTHCTLKDVTVKRSRLSGFMVQIVTETKFFDATGAQLAESEMWTFRSRSRAYGEQLAGVELKKWSQTELRELASEKRAERRRGAEPRYWEDTSVGESFTLLKGPLSFEALVMYAAAWHPEHLYRGDIPWDTTDPRYALPGPLGFPDLWARDHTDTATARGNGLAGAFDYGPQRHSWSSQLLTDWMGDHGFLEVITFQIRGFNFVGDIQRFKGTVERKRVDERRRLVDCRIECTSQRGETTGVGSATVRLPSRIPDV